MFKDTKTDAVSNVQNPKSFLDLFTLAFFNATHKIENDLSIRCVQGRDNFSDCKGLGGLCDIVRVGSPEYDLGDDKEHFFKHLVNPDTRFKFLENESSKRFFTTCVFYLAYIPGNEAIAFYTNNTLASILSESINVPLEFGNNNSFRVSGVGFRDLDLYDAQFGSAYKQFFGDGPNTPNFLREHDRNSNAIKFKKVDPDAVIPTKKRRSDTGLDITVIKKVKTDQWGNEWYDTGLQLEVPSGYYTELYGRSSLIKKGWQLANCTGIIDETYRNNLMCVFTRLHPDAPSLEEELPNRACQLILRKHEKAHAVEVEQLSNTDRGTGGFGSTGL